MKLDDRILFIASVEIARSTLCLKMVAKDAGRTVQQDFEAFVSARL
jgi:hypothetical protein